MIKEGGDKGDDKDDDDNCYKQIEGCVNGENIRWLKNKSVKEC
jgi:hypothetical protein